MAWSAILVTAILVAGCVSRPDVASRSPAEGPDADTTFYQEVSWSPDGETLLLSALQHGVYRILAVGIDGAPAKAITEGPRDLWAAWSPDGTRIAFCSKRGENVDIYVTNADGTNRVRLTDHPAVDSAPAWSPDGARIAFISERDGGSHVFVMNANGSGQTRVTDGDAEHWNPDWSPGGDTITYYATENGEDYIYVMNADGSDLVRLRRGVWPSWSPDGSRLLFTFGERGQASDVYVMAADGSDPTRIITAGFFATWSPDGRRIAFLRPTWRAEAGWPATSDLYVANADGSSVTRLTP